MFCPKSLISFLLGVALLGCHSIELHGSRATTSPLDTLQLFQKDGGHSFQISTHTANGPDAWGLAAGETRDLLNMEGPAIIRNFWMTF